MPLEVGTRVLGGRPFRLGDWLVEPSLNRISRGEESIQLELKWMDTLVCLAERAGEVVSRIEIIDRVWATEFITDNTLTHTIAELRNALGDDARNPTFIETIRQRGYRLIAPVKPAVSEEQMKSRVAKFPSPARPFSGDDERSPYPGLAAFTEADAEFFFGREAEVAQMWRRLTSRRLLAVIGPSGVGKSSFLRAGVIPAKPEGWGVLVCQPGEAPFAALARALVPEFAGDDDAISRLVGLGMPEEMAVMVGRWRQQHYQSLLIVDQFEELFTLNAADTQGRFAELLRRLVDDADVHVLLSMRDDFLHRCHEHDSLAPIFEILTPVKTPAESALHRALIEPAAQLGFTFEDEDLPGEMISEVEGGRSALPLLAFAISHLWAKRDREQKLITRQAYSDIGGVDGALSSHAETTLQAIGDERLPVVRELFRNLVTAEGTRAVREADELLSVFDTQDKTVGAGFIPARETAEGVLGHLIDARLLTSFEEEDVESDGRRRVEVIHESLLTSWPRLVRWQTQDADAAQLRDQLRQAARTWDEHDRSNDYLWTGRAYREFALWRDSYPGKLTDVEEDFAAAMTRYIKSRKRRRRIAVAAAFVVLLAVLAVVGVSRQQAIAEAKRAEAANLLALGRLELSPDPKACCPSAALAFAMAAIERRDSREARLIALEALWRGPTAFALEACTDKIKPFTPDGRSLIQPLCDEGFLVSRRQEASSTSIPVDFAKFGEKGWWHAHTTPDPDVIEVGTWNPRNIEYWSIRDRGLLKGLGEDSPCRFTAPTGSGSVICLETRGDVTDVRELPLRGGEARLLGSLDSATIGRISVWNRSLLTYAGRTLLLYDLDRLDAGPNIVGEHESPVTRAKLHGPAQAVVSADESGFITVTNLTLQETEVRRANQSATGSGRFNVDDTLRWLAAWHKNGITWLWDLHGPPSAEPKVLHRRSGKQVGQVSVDPRGEWVATGELLPGQLTLWPILDRHPFVLELDVLLWDLAFLPDGRGLVAGLADGTVRVWPLVPAGGPLSSVLFRAPSGYITDVDVDVRGRLVVASATTRGDGPWLIPLDGGDARSLPGFDDMQFAVAFSPDGRYAAAGGGHTDFTERVIRIWDTSTLEEVQVLGPPDGKGPGGGQIIRMAYAPDGKQIISSGWTGVLVWDLESGTYEHLGEGVVTSMTRDGKRMYVADHDWDEVGEAGGYDLETGEFIELPAHGRATSIVLAPDETTIVTGGIDGIIRVGPTSGEEPHLLLGHEGLIQVVAFSPDGRWIASGGSDGTLRVWPVPDFSKPPIHTLPREALLAKLGSFTNFRAVEDKAAPNGYRIDFVPVAGWPKMPEW